MPIKLIIMILTEQQKEYLVNKVNKKVNLPIVGERAEKMIFTKAIEKIMEKLEEELPHEILNYINDVSDGFIPGGEGNLQDAIDASVRMLNKEINIPLISEEKEQKLFTAIVESLFEAMKKGNKLAA